MLFGPTQSVSTVLAALSSPLVRQCKKKLSTVPNLKFLTAYIKIGYLFFCLEVSKNRLTFLPSKLLNNDHDFFPNKLRWLAQSMKSMQVNRYVR